LPPNAEHLFSMNLRHSLTVLVTAVALFAAAQTKTNKVAITDGPENDTKKSVVIGMFGHNDKGYFTLRREKKSLLVEHLNNSMAVDKSVEMEDLKLGKNDLQFIQALQMGDHFYMMYLLHDDKTEEVALLYKVLDPSSLLTEGQPIELAREKFVYEKKFMRGLIFAGFNPFRLLRSEDETHFLLMTSNPFLAEEGSDIKMKMEVFDTEFKKEWETDADLGFKSDLFTVSNITLDDNGDVSIVGVEYKEKLTAKQMRRAGKPNYTHHLIRYTEKGTKVMSMPIELNGKFITDLRIETALTGDVVVAGFYSEVGSFSIKGAFYLNIDPKTEQVKAEKFSEFDNEFITLGLTDREEKKVKKKEAKGEEAEMNEFDMRELILRGDGGATLIAEQYMFYVVTTTTRGANGQTITTSTYHYLYNDIIVISFNPDGELLWKTKIPKRQHTINDGGAYSSYSLMVTGDKLFFIFNDNPKNLFLAAEETPYNFSASKDLAVVIVEVDNSGKATKEMLFTTERGDAMVQPKISEQVNDNEMIICSQRSKIFQYSKLTFK
jgi:hypothetical protein